MTSVQIIDERGFLVLQIANLCVIRFKKLDRKGRSRNVLTRQQREWFTLQLVLPGMPPEAIRLIVGYQLDVLGNSIDNVLVTKPSGAYAVEWTFPISGDSGSNVVPMPIDPNGTRPTDIRSDGTEKPKKKKDNDDEQ